MRRLAAISLLLLLIALTSGASTIACAANCAQPPAATPAPAMMMHMHHHHTMGSAPGTSVGAQHCGGRVPRVLAQRVIVPGPQHSLAAGSRSAQAGNVAGSFEPAAAPVASSPPGPPLLPTQLRI